MHRGGQRERDGTGCKRRTGGPIGGTQREAGTGQRDATAGRQTHTTHPTRLPPTSLLGAAVRWGKYPVFKIMCKMFLEKLKGLFFS